MANDTIYSWGPTHTERLLCARFVDGDLPGTRRLARFEIDVLWLRESQTQTFLLWDGKQIKEGSTYSDFYGFLTDVDEDGAKWAASLAVTSKDRLEVCALTTISESAVVVVPKERWERSDKGTYTAMDRVMVGTQAEFDRLEAFRWEDPLAEDEWTPMSIATTDRREVESVVVYSSKRTPEENAAVKDALRSKYADGLRKVEA